KSAEDFGKTILGASAMLDLDYADVRSGQRVGPTLLHVAATNRPHLVDLEPYTDAVAASASSSEVVMLSYPQPTPTRQGHPRREPMQLTARDVAEAIAELADRQQESTRMLSGAIAQLAAESGHSSAHTRTLGLSYDEASEVDRLTLSHPALFGTSSPALPG